MYVTDRVTQQTSRVVLKYTSDLESSEWLCIGWIIIIFYTSCAHSNSCTFMNIRGSILKMPHPYSSIAIVLHHRRVATIFHDTRHMHICCHRYEKFWVSYMGHKDVYNRYTVNKPLTKVEGMYLLHKLWPDLWKPSILIMNPLWVCTHIQFFTTLNIGNINDCVTKSCSSLMVQL